MSDNKIIKFPPSIREIFREIDEDRKIKGNVTINRDRFAAYCKSLESVNYYGELVHRKIIINADDPREPYDSHTLLVKFGTSEFEGSEIGVLVDIISVFDNIEFFADDNNDIFVICVMDGIYEQQ